MRAVADSVRALLQDALTADAAVQIALLNNRALQATYEELGIAQADLVEAGLLKNPIFETELRFPSRSSNPWELHVVQDFVDVFYIPLRRKIAGTALEAAKLRVADAAPLQRDADRAVSVAACQKRAGGGGQAVCRRLAKLLDRAGRPGACRRRPASIVARCGNHARGLARKVFPRNPFSWRSPMITRREMLAIGAATIAAGSLSYSPSELGAAIEIVSLCFRR